MRSRRIGASRARSSALAPAARSIESWDGAAVTLTLGTSEIAMQTTANQVLVIFDEAATGFTKCEVIGRDAEDQRLDEVQHGQAVVAVRTEAIGDIAQLAGELGDATEGMTERRLGVRLREGAR